MISSNSEDRRGTAPRCWGDTFNAHRHTLAGVLHRLR
jgi:hypothetical protein